MESLYSKYYCTVVYETSYWEISLTVLRCTYFDETIHTVLQSRHLNYIFSVLLVVDWDSVRHCSDTHYFHVHTNMVKDVGMLRIFPGITRATVSIRAFKNVVIVFKRVYVDKSVPPGTHAGGGITDLR